MYDSRGSNNISLSYSCQHLSDVQASSLAQVLRMAVLAVLQQPAEMVKEFDLPPEEQRLKIQSWNSNPPKYAPECTYDQFRASVNKHPHQIAVDAWDGRMTYRDLDERPSALAACLQGLGLNNGDNIMVCSEKSKLVPVAWLAIFKIGAVLVPVDVQQPVERLKKIVTAANIAGVIATPKSHGIAKQLHATVCTVKDGVEVGCAAQSPIFISPLVEPSDLAYIMFTSGSTGTPKGITITHGAFASMAAKVSPIFQAKRLLQFASYSFTPAIYKILMAICTLDGCVFIPSDHDRVKDLENYINDARVDWAMIVPSVLRPLKPENLKSLKTVVLVGEPIPRSEAKRWTHNTRILYCYASSENGLVSFNGRVDRVTDMRNVGYSNRTCWVVDPSNHNRLQPLGVPGEAVVYSPSSPISYLNNAEQTKEAMVDNADWIQTAREGFRFCRTGDLMYHNSDGNFSLSGRSDLTIKVRGQRVELPEVERSVVAEQEVRQAVGTVPKKGKCAERLPVVFIWNKPYPPEGEVVTFGGLTLVPSRLTAEVTAALQQSLSQKLPEYMIPAVWVVIKAMPLTASGKVDRVAVTEWLQCLDTDAISMNSI